MNHNKKLRTDMCGERAPQVGLEPTTTRLTAECSAIELLRIIYWDYWDCRDLSDPSLSLIPLAYPVIGVLEKLSLLQPFSPSGSRRRPTLPGRCQPSTISAKRLNFCVRYGNRWIPLAIITGNCMSFSIRRFLLRSHCPQFAIVVWLLPSRHTPLLIGLVPAFSRHWRRPAFAP